MLGEVEDRIEQIIDARDRMDGLIEAMLTVTSGLDLDRTLRTIVHTAISLVDVPYGALEPEPADHAEAVVREALSNTVRHSGAASVSVEITLADDLTIVVEDDGCGMPGEVTPSGLTNLARRAEEAAGSFTVASGTGSDGDSAGTRLCWKVPLR